MFNNIYIFENMYASSFQTNIVFDKIEYKKNNFFASLLCLYNNLLFLSVLLIIVIKMKVTLLVFCQGLFLWFLCF